jgi:hypothetical protein
MKIGPRMIDMIDRSALPTSHARTVEPVEAAAISGKTTMAEL